MEVRSIKNVDSETWKRFKVLASREGLSMAVLLRSMISGYEKKKASIWGMIFERGENLTKKESDDIEKEYKSLRKEKEFRI